MNFWYISIGCFVVAFTVALIYIHFSEKSDVSLLQLVTTNGELSTPKILQLVGGIVGTWIVIKMTLTSTMTWDIFSIYLAYVASVDGFAQVIAVKFGAQQNQPTYRPYRSANRDESERVGGAKAPDID